jgi:hypothetical protein
MLAALLSLLLLSRYATWVAMGSRSKKNLKPVLILKVVMEGYDNCRLQCLEIRAPDV